MKLIELAIRTKQVEYFGMMLDIPETAKYLACDDSGELYAYESKPLKSTRPGSEFWKPDYRATENTASFHIGYVDLEGMDWKDTLVSYE